MVGNLQRFPFIATALNETVINMYNTSSHFYVSNHRSILSYEYALGWPPDQYLFPSLLRT